MATKTANQARPSAQLRRAFATPMGLVALICLALVLFLAAFGPFIWGEASQTRDLTNLSGGPSAEHWAGTDAGGRDMLARVLVASRLSIMMALESTAISLVVGLILGSAPIILGRRVGRVVNWFIGIAVAFPGLLLALFFAVVFGSGAHQAAVAIGLAGGPSFARLCQTLIAGVLGRDYVAAAKVGGVGRFRLFGRHVLPNIGEPLVVNATIGAGNALLAFASLSFLGLGVQMPQFDWGRLLKECLEQQFRFHPLASLTPGYFVVVAGLAFSLTGESIARAMSFTSLGDLGLRGKARRRAAQLAAVADAARAPDTASATVPDAVLTVRDLTVTFPAGPGEVRPVRGVSFDIGPGEAVGLVGESGSGKSLTALAVAGLIESPGRVAATELGFLGEDLSRDGAGAHRRLLGTSLAMVFQDPMSSLNPTQKVGHQLAELAHEHGDLSWRQAQARAVDRLAAVRLPEAKRRAKQYPHEYSGGMRQRAMIGLGVMLTPKLIIADEPTTALDVTVQEQVLDLLQAIRREDGVALLFISHDVSVVGDICDRVMVMYAGRIVETLPVTRLHGGAAHPYTRALVAAVPTMATDLDQPLPTIPGRPVEPAEVPPGCAFAARCPLADARCREQEPALEPWLDGQVACWRPVGADTPATAATLGGPRLGAVPTARRAVKETVETTRVAARGAVDQAKAAARDAAGQVRDALRSAADQTRRAVLGEEEGPTEPGHEEAQP